MALIAFYILSTIVVLSALFVVAARNPVHSVLWLILAFFTSAGLLVLIGAEFLAMLLVVVYVGAVAVLFLFVVMMLDIDFVGAEAGLPELSCRRGAGGAGAAGGDRDRGGGRDVRRRRDVQAEPGRCDQRRGAVESALHGLPAAVPDVGHRAAGRHDGRHRADAALAAERQAPEHRRSRPDANARTPSNSRTCVRGRGSDDGRRWNSPSATISRSRRRCSPSACSASS